MTQELRAAAILKKHYTSIGGDVNYFVPFEKWQKGMVYPATIAAMLEFLQQEAPAQPSPSLRWVKASEPPKESGYYCTKRIYRTSEYEPVESYSGHWYGKERGWDLPVKNQPNDWQWLEEAPAMAQPSPVGVVEAIAFAEWIIESGYINDYGFWKQHINGTKFTTEQLYQLFLQHQPSPAAQPTEEKVNESGGFYYDLFAFFSENHGLTLLDSDIQDIIHAVNKFEKWRTTHFSS